MGECTSFLGAIFPFFSSPPFQWLSLVSNNALCSGVCSRLSNNVVHCLFVFEATKLKVHEVLTHELSVIFYFQQFGTCACCQLPVAIVKYLIAGSILYQ